MSEQAALDLASYAAEMTKQQHERELQRLARLATQSKENDVHAGRSPGGLEMA